MYTTFSKILLIIGNKDIGLEFSQQSSSLSFLYNGTTLAILHKSGKIPVAKDKLMILESFSEKNYRLLIYRL